MNLVMYDVMYIGSGAEKEYHLGSEILLQNAHMKPTLIAAKTIAFTVALVCASHAWAQTPGDMPSNARKGIISTPVQPSIKPQVQTSTPPKNTKTWDDKRYLRKTVTGVTSPAPVYSPKPAETKSKHKSKSESKHGHCPPGLAKKNNGCLPPGQAK
jgi:hypothetical protein